MARIAGSNGRETAERIREAALRLFARHGYAAVSMREIAGDVGIGAAAIYNHFATKQDLLADLMSRHFACLMAGWMADPGSAKSTAPEEALAAFTLFHIRYQRENADEVSVAYMELRSLEQPNFHRFDHLRRSFEEQLTSILERGVAAGTFHTPDVNVASLAILAMLTGMNGWFRQTARVSVAEAESIYVDMVARAVTPLPVHAGRQSVSHAVQ
ncbi:MAG: TetR/AcrR family transcriptional regulator [Pikeienuella sp.]